MIKISNVSLNYLLPKRYIEYLRSPFTRNKFRALSNINLVIKQGDRVAIMGPNGAGKSTILKLIGGLLYASEGCITINGINPIDKLLEYCINVNFVLNEERSFYWRLTGYKNLKFFAALDNIYSNKFRERLKEVMQDIDLAEYIHKPFSSYSSGMKQKLALVRGLLREPKILILDEPTRTLDLSSTEDIRKILLNKICANNDKILLISTHRIEEALSLCNKVCFIDKGKILYYDSIDETITKYGNLNQAYNYYLNNIPNDSEI